LARQSSGVSRSRWGFFRITSRKDRVMVIVIKERHVCMKKTNSYEGIVTKFDIEENSRHLTRRPAYISLFISSITC